MREALTLQERLVQRDPRSREYRAEQAASVSALGAIELAQGKPEEAAQLLARGEADYRELIKNYSAEPDYRFGLASVRINQAEQLKSARKLAEAETALREAIELLGALGQGICHTVPLRSRAEQSSAQPWLACTSTVNVTPTPRRISVRR